MSIALLVTAGFGNGTLSGSISDVVLRGYSIGENIVDTPDCFAGFVGAINGNAGYSGVIDFSTTAVIGPVLDMAASIGVIAISAGYVGGVVTSAGYVGAVDDSDTGFDGPVTDQSGYEGDLCGC